MLHGWDDGSTDGQTHAEVLRVTCNAMGLPATPPPLELANAWDQIAPDLGVLVRSWADDAGHTGLRHERGKRRFR